jgi:FkbM family methyltransferase
MLPGEIGTVNLERHRRFSRVSPERAFAQALKDTEGFIAIDLGANVGEYTLRLAGSASTVYAFEPDPDTFLELQCAVGDRDDVVLLQEAAGAEEAELPLFRLSEDSEGGVVPSKATTIMGHRDKYPVDESGLTVRVRDFAAFLDDIEGEIGIIKVDIEGAEVDLLDRLIETGTINRARYIFVETHEWLYPEQRADVARLYRATRPAALRSRFPDAAWVPDISLDWN